MTDIENCFKQEIKENYTVKKLSKYVAAFDYINKFLIFLSPTSGGFCLTSSVSVVGTPVGIAGAGFTLIFSLTTGIIKKLLSITKNKKKKHNKTQLNSIETLVPQALINIEKSHKEFNTILKEKHKFKKMKENVRNAGERSFAEKQENMRLNSRLKKDNEVVDNLRD